MHITHVLSGSDLGNPWAEGGNCTNYGISRICRRDGKTKQKTPHTLFLLFQAWQCWFPFPAYDNQVLQVKCTKGFHIKWWKMVLLAKTNSGKTVHQSLLHPFTNTQISRQLWHCIHKPVTVFKLKLNEALWELLSYLKTHFWNVTAPGQPCWKEGSNTIFPTGYSSILFVTGCWEGWMKSETWTKCLASCFMPGGPY